MTTSAERPAFDVHALPGEDTVVEGLRLHVTTYGAGPGEPVLMLHGVATSGYLWHAVARDLGSRRRVLAPDLVGLGRSERPAERGVYRLDAAARQVAALVRAHGLARVAVAGHDLGGAVAVHLAATEPDLVSALVLLDCPLHRDAWPPAGLVPWLLPGAASALPLVLRHRPRWARAALRVALGGVLTDPAVQERHLAPLLGAEGPRGLSNLLAAVDLVPVEQALALVAADPPPTLVLWGERDLRYSPAYGRRVAAALPGATLVTLADTGHLLPQERPERVAEEIDAFLDAALPPGQPEGEEPSAASLGQ